MIVWWQVLIIGIVVLLIGLIAGFFISKAWFQKYLKKNPPIDEKTIREMFRQMGRTPSEKQVRQILSSMQQK